MEKTPAYLSFYLILVTLTNILLLQLTKLLELGLCKAYINIFIPSKRIP